MLIERNHGLPHAGLYTQPRWLNTRVSPLITASLSEVIPVSGNVLRHLPCGIQRTLDSSSAGEWCCYFHLAIQKIRLGRGSSWHTPGSGGAKTKSVCPRSTQSLRLCACVSPVWPPSSCLVIVSSPHHLAFFSRATISREDCAVWCGEGCGALEKLSLSALIRCPLFRLIYRSSVYPGHTIYGLCRRCFLS